MNLLIDNTVRKELAMALLSDRQTMKQVPASPLGSPAHHGTQYSNGYLRARGCVTVKTGICKPGVEIVDNDSGTGYWCKLCKASGREYLEHLGKGITVDGQMSNAFSEIHLQSTLTDLPHP